MAMKGFQMAKILFQAMSGFAVSKDVDAQSCSSFLQDLSIGHPTYMATKWLPYRKCNLFTSHILRALWKGSRTLCKLNGPWASLKQHWLSRRQQRVGCGCVLVHEETGKPLVGASTAERVMWCHETGERLLWGSHPRTFTLWISKNVWWLGLFLIWISPEIKAKLLNM